MALSPPLPDPIESDLVRLLDGPDEEFWPGVARLCQQHPTRTKDIQREAERLQAAKDAKRARGSTAPPVPPPPKPIARDDADLQQGDRVGPFVVLGEIGHGGMGSVYLAEQREPVRRRVALKVIKLGMDTKAVLEDRAPLLACRVRGQSAYVARGTTFVFTALTFGAGGARLSNAQPVSL